MIFPRFVHSLFLSLAILRTAALLVPRRQRVEWFAEWRAELWHVWHASNGEVRGSSRGREQVTAFCLGAFQDALWLRRNDLYLNNSTFAPSNLFQLGSPLRCGSFLVALAAASMLLAYHLPGARKVILPSPYLHPQTLVLISRSGHLSEPSPTIPLAEYRSWTTSTHSLFTGIAFYQPILKRVHIARHSQARLSIARASDNLLQLLNVSTSPGASNLAKQPYAAKLVLSRAAWRKYFHQDPQILGHVLQVAGQQATLVGVIADDSWRLPGHIDAWLLEDKHHLALLPSQSKGFVIADLRTSAFPAPEDGQWEMSVPNPNGGADSYDCVSLAERSKQPIFVFLFALALACLALPATTSLPLGEYPANSKRLHIAKEMRRWSFLAVKIALILMIVALLSIDLAHCSPSIDSLSSQYIQLAVSFSALLFAFRWALRDQRKRCPVCLRVLTSPARVGESSRNFLAWNGTELICVGGHGLLHVPDMPTSWFSTQRWLYLDPSWRGLFYSPIASP